MVIFEEVYNINFDLFKKTTQSNIKLVLAGNRYDWTKEMENAFQQCSSNSDIVFTERLLQKDMIQLMGSAICLTYVSYFEGFGMPILEAQTLGRAVITSNLDPMTYVGGKGALYVNPKNIKSIRNGVKQIISNGKLRDKLIANGFENIKRFKKRNILQGHLNCYFNILKHNL